MVVVIVGLSRATRGQLNFLVKYGGENTVVLFLRPNSLAKAAGQFVFRARILAYCTISGKCYGLFNFFCSVLKFMVLFRIL